MKARPMDSVSWDEYLGYGVWEFDLDEEHYEPEQDESWVRPVLELPVTDLSNAIVATRVNLANGSLLDAFLDCITLNDPHRTKIFLNLTARRCGKSFSLARYFDFDYEENGPDGLAEFLGLTVDEVFPISYDISNLAVGHPDVVKGKIQAVPEEAPDEAERSRIQFGK